MEENSENNSPATVVKTEPNLVRLEPEWPYRVLGNIVFLGIIALLSLIILTLKNDLVEKRIAEFKTDFFEITKKNGWGLDDVVISGRNRSTKEEILKVLNLNRGDNVLEINLYDLKNKVETLPWVRNAVVKRSFFPNVISVEIEEKQVSAIWQYKENFYPVDFDGKVINADFRTQEPVLLIVGEGAPENVTALLNAINDGGDAVLKRIKVANFISKRRWNLILDDIKDGITIKMPEDDVEKAWKKLLKLNTTKGILKRKLTIIDLRLKDKVVVKLKKSPKDSILGLNNHKESKM